MDKVEAYKRLKGARDEMFMVYLGRQYGGLDIRFEDLLERADVMLKRMRDAGYDEVGVRC